MTASWMKRLRESEQGRQALERERLVLEVTEQISMLMHQEGVNRSELAERLGTSPAFVTKLLSGAQNMTLKTVADAFYALGASAHIAVGDVGDPVRAEGRARPRPASVDLLMIWGEQMGASKAASLLPSRKGSQRDPLGEFAA